ncbi:MAG TPA: hypothetical protein PLO05_05525 [Bacteroidales bacterium]|jgi:hypothetical protein|nr:hypothetical protein [Bacteroidales bacterium]MDD4235515.1 hypothetical protein [Bacteroidales bacterium]HXK81598.1 hypothetical protein [Bacteroidales bacterium]
MKKIIHIFCFLFVPAILFADGEHPPVGARSAGMAGISLINNDVWAVFNNQAAMSGISQTSVGLYYENRFLLKETGFAAFALSTPLLGGNIGVSVSHFGYQLYNENKFGLAYAIELFKNVSMGIKMDYHYTHQPYEYGNRNALSFEIGLFAIPTENLKVGIHAYNPLQLTYIGYSDEYLPVCLAVGAGYTFSKKLTISAEAEKILQVKPIIFRIGLEYKSEKGLALRTGITTYPIRASFGLGFIHNNLSANIAYSWHQVLGSTPHISLAYAF